MIRPLQQTDPGMSSSRAHRRCADQIAAAANASDTTCRSMQKDRQHQHGRRPASGRYSVVPA